MKHPNQKKHSKKSLEQNHGSKRGEAVREAAGVHLSGALAAGCRRVRSKYENPPRNSETLDEKSSSSACVS
jgi:hypothetical protein